MPFRPRYNQETVDAILVRFQEAPPAPVPTSYSAAALVRSLAPKIHEMNKRGYSWDAIARMMAGDGVHLSANVLRKYASEGLHKAKTNKKKTTSRASQDDGQPRPVPNSPSSPSRAAPAATPPPVPTSGRSVATSPREPRVPGGDLVVRPNTPDL